VHSLFLMWTDIGQRQPNRKFCDMGDLVIIRILNQRYGHDHCKQLRSLAGIFMWVTRLYFATVSAFSLPESDVIACRSYCTSLGSACWIMTADEYMMLCYDEK